MSQFEGIRRDPVKVKVIMTKFVQTDAGSFKSVVQNMTGRDSKVIDELIREGGSTGCGAGGHSKQIMAGRTAVAPPKEIERVWKDIPEWDELLRLCSQ